MQFVCRTSANDGGTELCVQVKKKWVSKRRRLTCFVNLKGKCCLWGQIHLLATNTGSPVSYSSVDLAGHRQALGRARGWGRQESLGRGGNSLCFTDMNIQNLNSSVPACLFPELSNWPQTGELLCKSWARRSSVWVWGTRLLHAKFPGSQWARDVFYQISGTHGTAVSKPPPRSSLCCSPLHSHRWSLLAAQ